MGEPFNSTHNIRSPIIGPSPLGPLPLRCSAAPAGDDGERSRGGTQDGAAVTLPFEGEGRREAAGGVALGLKHVARR